VETGFFMAHQSYPPSSIVHHCFQPSMASRRRFKWVLEKGAYGFSVWALQLKHLEMTG